MTTHHFRAAGLTFGLLAVTCLFPPVRATAQTDSYSVFKKDYLGLWNVTDNIGWRSVDRFNEDGTCSSNGARFGTWSLEQNKLLVRYDAHPDWINRYDLPIHNGILKGKTSWGDARTLTQRASAAPAATYTALTGNWEYHNQDNDHRAIVALTADGTIAENGRPIGAWVVENNHLFYSYAEHHDWVDDYPLPPKDGVLHSASHLLTLTQQKAVPAGSGAVAVATNATGGATPASVTRVGTGTKTNPAAAGTTGGYFGSLRPGDPASANTASRSTVPLPTLAPPPPPVVARPMGGDPVSSGVATGAAQPGVTAAPTPVPSVAAVATATPAPDLLTPVGRWHWHSGIDITLTEKGAVLEDANVAGQWRWTNKDKGEIQIQWSGTHYRPPVTYSVSPHGHHLNGSDPAHKDRTYSEERAE